MRLSLAAGLIYCAMLFGQGPASTSISPLVGKFESTYRTSRSLRANFVEKYFAGGKLVRSDAGVAYFARPGKMRWEYRSPEANLYVVDGKWSWFYVPGDHTVTKIAAKRSFDFRTPFALLAGEMKVSRICGSVDREASLTPTFPGGVVLRCNPHKEERAAGSGRSDQRDASERSSFVTFELNGSTGELVGVVVHDPGGVQVEFQFANWEFNPRVEPSLFQFQPPKGVAIVDGDMGLPRGSEGSPDNPKP